MVVSADRVLLITNGMEVAAKFLKIKLKLHDRDLKKFTKEVALQAKVRVSFILQRTLNYIVRSGVCDIYEHLSNAPPPPTPLRCRCATSTA